MKSKKAAIELSMTTIVVVVLSLTLLIMGFILVRSIMCTAIGLTDDVGTKAKKQISDFFDTSSYEIYCVGQGDPTKVAPGINNVWCGFNSKIGGTYKLTIKEIKPISSALSKTTDYMKWVTVKQESVTVSPEKRESQKIVTLDIPEDAQEGTIRLTLEVKKEGSTATSTIPVDWEISRTGTIRAVMC
ncbi:hypothetical protein HYW74_00080 [Candidatus Pacearchaeota archaeon]|nr:hypothetical protein [Candidatus Pacearchaeota archaeon]